MFYRIYSPELGISKLVEASSQKEALEKEAKRLALANTVRAKPQPLDRLSEKFAAELHVSDL